MKYAIYLALLALIPANLGAELTPELAARLRSGNVLERMAAFEEGLAGRTNLTAAEKEAVIQLLVKEESGASGIG